jgi:hypothetical protein
MLRQTEKNSVGIRLHVAILGLGRNSGASGDFQLTRSAPCFEDAVFKTLIAEVFSWTKPDVCQVDGRRPAIRSPEANGGGVSASRFADAGCFTRTREFERPVPAVLAGADRWGRSNRRRQAVLSPRPLRVAVGPNRQARSGKFRLADFVGADRFGLTDRRPHVRRCRPLRTRWRVLRDRCRHRRIAEP